MTTATLLEDFVAEALPAHRRTHLEFAEQEVILPNGPRKGMQFSADFMAFSREVLGEFSANRYQDYYGSGPAQAGKTLIFFVIPSLYHLFEVEEDVILGAPVVEMAQSAYVERLLPAIEKSRFARLLPRTGGGSRGGKALAVRFGNGALLRFMGAGGGDQQRSSYTARVVIGTELDKMDSAGMTSREADPVSQLKARSAAFGAAARFYGECTMSTKRGRIYREVVENGTDSRVLLPCPSCGVWVWPERSGLIGWQEAPDVLAARAGVRFKCPACSAVWAEIDRQKALRNPRVAAKGQTVTAAGVVEGPLPPTLTYGFRWNAMASPLVTMADVAADEWKAEQSGLQADQKALAQFRWAEAWEGEIVDLSRTEVGTVLQKIAGHARGDVPPGIAKLTLGIDVGSYVIWWTLVAWRDDAQGHVVDFGGLTVPDGKVNPAAVLASLRAFRENVIVPGWGGRQPDRILIDSGYEKDVVYQFVKESGEGRYLACKGFGTSSRHGGWRNPTAAEATDTRSVGDEYFVTLQPAGVKLVNVHSDHWKSLVHAGFGAAPGAPGSLTIWHGPKTDPDLRTFARMIVAEQPEYKASEGKEQRIVWVVKSRSNHYLDATAYARCAAAIEGIRMVKLPPPPARPKVVNDGGRLKWSRDRY